jgi:hypothetical protein
LHREFHLSPRGKGRGVSCDADGAFIGAIPVLARLQKNGKDEWQPRACGELSDEIGEHYGLPIDMSSKTGGLRAIANALNQGDIARAQIATVLLGIPDPPPLAKGTHSRDAMIKLIRDLHWSGMIKEDWNPDDHPRWPGGNHDGKGGQFAPKGEGGGTGAAPTSQSDAVDRTGSRNFESDAPHRSARVQLADAGNVTSDASDSPLAEAARAAVAEQRHTSAPHPQAKPVDDEHENFWQTLDSRLSPEIKSALSEVGSVAAIERAAHLSAPIDAVDAMAHALKGFVDYRAQLWKTSDGRQVMVSMIPIGDRNSNRLVAWGRSVWDRNNKFMRPATNADWIDPLINYVTAFATIAGSAFRLAGRAVEALDTANVAAFSTGATEYRATFGKALTNDYRATFFEANPGLESQVVVHHAVPQRTLMFYPDEVTESEIHSLENLRGIPNELNSDVHLSQIAREWNQFYKANPNATQEQLLQKATEIDLKYGGRFKPPVARGR